MTPGASLLPSLHSAPRPPAQGGRNGATHPSSRGCCARLSGGLDTGTTCVARGAGRRRAARSLQSVKSASGHASSRARLEQRSAPACVFVLVCVAGDGASAPPRGHHPAGRGARGVEHARRPAATLGARRAGEKRRGAARSAGDEHDRGTHGIQHRRRVSDVTGVGGRGKKHTKAQALLQASWQPFACALSRVCASCGRLAR